MVTPTRRAGNAGVEVVRMWAGHLVRRGWRATIFLALLAGLAGGIAMAAWSAGRRTSTVFDRFVAYADPPELIVTFCPPGFRPTDEESLAQCFAYDSTDETATMSALPEVEAAGSASFRGLEAARPEEPDRTWLAGSSLGLAADIPSWFGRPILVAGRPAGARAADEVVVNERFVEQSGVAIGEELDITFWAPDEIGSVPAAGVHLTGPTARVRVVGIVRSIVDLDAPTNDINRVIDEATVTGGPALAAATNDAAGFGGVAVNARDGDGAAAVAAIEEAFQDRAFNVSEAIGEDELAPIREAIEYEARAAMAFAAIAAIAVAVFVGQAVSRQSRREWADGPTLRALGMSNRDVRWAALLRGAVIGAAAAGVAAAVAVALSPLAPIGVGRRAEIDPGPALDALVLTTGATAVLAAVTLATWLPLPRAARLSPGGMLAAGRRVSIRGPLPAAAIAGLGMTVGRRRDGRGIPIGTALAGVALAVGAAVAAAGLTASLDKLTSTPERFGALWDVSVTNVGPAFSDSVDDFGAVLTGDPAVSAAAGIVGIDIDVDGEVIWVQAFRPLPGLEGIRPLITAGREPVTIDEIALGSITMDNLGVRIGDRIGAQSMVSSGASGELTVVGATVVNDTYEPSPGRGGVVALEWMETYAPEVSTDPYVVRLRPGTDVDEFRAVVEGRSTAITSPPIAQVALLNVQRIGTLPYLLAALIGVLAVASLAHALVLSIRRSRGQLAVWKAMGFTRRQVGAAVAFHATALAGGAAVVGVPLGVIVGRLGWRLVAERIGVVSGPVTPLLGITLTVLGATVTANVIATYPAWRAARVPTAEALRVE